MITNIVGSLGREDSPKGELVLQEGGTVVQVSCVPGCAWSSSSSASCNYCAVRARPPSVSVSLMDECGSTVRETCWGCRDGNIHIRDLQDPPSFALTMKNQWVQTLFLLYAKITQIQNTVNSLFFVYLCIYCLLLQYVVHTAFFANCLIFSNQITDRDLCVGMQPFFSQESLSLSHRVGLCIFAGELREILEKVITQ